jgi:putative ABC transport system ATP-binding protein
MIEIEDITKKFYINKNSCVTALENINLTLNEGELVVLKGASGSGKSTLLSLIAALSKPTSGEVIVDLKHISKLPDSFASEYRNNNIGFIFQKYNLIPTLSVKENILLPLIPSNPQDKEVEEKLNHVMEMFHISHKADSLVKNLSGGEQQRVAIARANINDPKIILADEPTANLDEKLSLHFIEMLRDMKKDKKTIIVATHDPLFFELDFVDRFVEINKGKML